MKKTRKKYAGSPKNSRKIRPRQIIASIRNARENPSVNKVVDEYISPSPSPLPNDPIYKLFNQLAEQIKSRNYSEFKKIIKENISLHEKNKKLNEEKEKLIKENNEYKQGEIRNQRKATELLDNRNELEELIRDYSEKNELLEDNKKLLEEKIKVLTEYSKKYLQLIEDLDVFNYLIDTCFIHIDKTNGVLKNLVDLDDEFISIINNTVKDTYKKLSNKYGEELITAVKKFKTNENKFLKDYI